MRQVMKETQERVRLFEDNQRKWQEQQQVDSPQMVIKTHLSLCMWTEILLRKREGLGRNGRNILSYFINNTK